MTDPTDAKDVNWVYTPIIKLHDNPPPESQWEYGVWLPDWLAEWDVFANWEHERFDSMRDNLKQGDILFDIGAELGWQSMIYAKYVGAENMVLIEPEQSMWPNIKATWDRNFPYHLPLACVLGLMSDQTTSKDILYLQQFPAEGDGKLAHHVAYQYIHDHGARVPQITLDDFCELTGIVPDALTMDTEGAELLILRGAEKNLREHDLKVWVSIHDELGTKDYGLSAQDVHDFMTSCGYSGEYLATDHEEHWYFTKVAA